MYLLNGAFDKFREIYRGTVFKEYHIGTLGKYLAAKLRPGGDHDRHLPGQIRDKSALVQHLVISLLSQLHRAHGEQPPRCF